MKLFRWTELIGSLILWVAVIAHAKAPAYRHRHQCDSIDQEMKVMKKEQEDEIKGLRDEISEMRKEMVSHFSQPTTNPSTITEENNSAQTLAWTRKVVHELHTEIKEISKHVNSSRILHELHQLNNHVKRLTSETTDCMNLGRTQEARLDKMDNLVERLKYELKNTDIKVEEVRQQVVGVAKDMNHKIIVVGESAEQNPKKHHKIRHNKMVHTQILRLSHTQDQLDNNQQNMNSQMLDHQRRLDRLEEPNWNLLNAKIDLLQLESKVFSDRLNNNTQTLSDLTKVHKSMLELREDLEAVENKIDKVIPEFRKEISKLDINQAQNNAQYSYTKEDQDNLRKSVKAIAVSMSNAQDKAEADREELKKMATVVKDLTTEAKKHFFRLNDHILKSETNHSVSETNAATEIVPLPELMGEIKDLQPVEREYEDLVAQLPKDCSGISGPAGPYLIRPGHVSVDARCVNGSTVVQRRFNGSVEFNRKYKEYVHGFGNPASEYWLGLETTHQLTADNCSSAKIEMTDIYGTLWYAEYENFYVGSADTGYVLKVSGFTGNSSDALGYQNNMEFSAIDRDRDISNTNCAANYEGGWWFSHCQHVNINGKYILGLTWFDSNHNEWIAVATSEMRIFRRPGCL